MAKSRINRRKAIKGLAAGTSAAFFSSAFSKEMNTQNGVDINIKGNIKQSVCSWCFPKFTLDELSKASKSIGLVGIDLVPPSGWNTLKKYDLISTMCTPEKYSLTEGWNKIENHEMLVDGYLKLIDLVADAGYSKIFCASGNSFGMDKNQGIENCEKGLKRILSKAEKRKVNIVMELLNSKVDHKDYMCDKTDWGVKLCKTIGSNNFKLLFDIYHMQIMEGDIIRTIKKNHDFFAHYHTAGVPGRNEIDQSQELFYPAIMRAIHSTGFDGIVAQEFIPKSKNPINSLKEAVVLCDI
ncbi:MAG: TIM barrel protein [Flavobacteriaceae bacterium]|nr:TIM barrel protein [Flavobacteriaceae bacterium]